MTDPSTRQGGRPTTDKHKLSSTSKNMAMSPNQGLEAKMD